MNPLFSSMNGNEMNVVLNMLQQRNPQAYQQFMQLKNSGGNPQQILNNMMSNMNENQKQMIRSFGNQFMKK